MTSLSMALRSAALTAALALAGAGCSTTSGNGGAASGVATPRATARGAGAARATAPMLHREEVLWLDRVSFGLDSDSVAEYRHLGRPKFLEQQLHPQSPALPAPIAAEIAALEVTHADPQRWLAEVDAHYKTINAMPAGDDKEQARKTLNERGNRLAYEAVRRDLLRAVYSPAQLQEQMVWFWLNHFSVYQNKANIRWLIGDYEERAIRPNVFGHFKDLVLATLEHPAMLQYLDNNQNAVGHINENYARELMELHTLGVGGGYSQQDVQNLRVCSRARASTPAMLRSSSQNCSGCTCAMEPLSSIPRAMTSARRPC